MSRIVLRRYRNWLQVCIWFGPCLSFACNARLALPCVSTFNLLMWVALAPIAARTSSFW